MNDQINNRNIIIWEKWKDPFGYETEEQIEDSYNDENGESVTTNVKRTRCHLIQTPFGIIPFNENMASSEIFNFWTGHSNFPITKKISDIIENTDGVETLNIFTKYRFRIAIGKSFKDSIVMTNINNNVYEYLGEYYV